MDNTLMYEKLDELLCNEPDDFSKLDQCKVFTYFAYKLNPQLLPSISQFCDGVAESLCSSDDKSEWKYLARSYFRNYTEDPELEVCKLTLTGIFEHVFSQEYFKNYSWNKEGFDDNHFSYLADIWLSKRPSLRKKLTEYTATNTTINEAHFFPEILDDVKDVLNNGEAKPIIIDAEPPVAVPIEEAPELYPLDTEPNKNLRPVFPVKFSF